MIIYHDCAQGSPAWFKKRKGLWTGSKALRLLQGKPYKEDEEWGGNDATRRGHALEVAAIREYERKYQCKVLRPGGVTNTVYPNAWYSPDGIDGKNKLLEIKSFNKERHKALLNGQIPLEIMVQIYFGMIITGCRKASLLAFNPEFEQQLVEIPILYNKNIGKNIRKKLRLDIKNRQPTS